MDWITGWDNSVLGKDPTHGSWRDSGIRHLMALLLGRHNQAQGFGLLWVFSRFRHTEGIHLTVAECTHRVVQGGGGYRVEVLRWLRRLEHSCRRRRSNMRWHIDLVHVVHGFRIVRGRVVHVHRHSHRRKRCAV